MLSFRHIPYARTLSQSKASPKCTPSLSSISRPKSRISRLYATKTFDYNAQYFSSTKFRLEVDELTGNRSIFASEDLSPNEIILITPYYNHVLHSSCLPQFCATCHDSLRLLGLTESAIRSKFVKAHRYCSEACRDRGEPIDEIMSQPLRIIQKKDPDFFVSYRCVYFAYSRIFIPSPLLDKSSF